MTGASRALLLLLLTAPAFAGDKDADAWLDGRALDKTQAVEAAGGVHADDVKPSSAAAKGDGRLQSARLEGGGTMEHGFQGADARKKAGGAPGTSAVEKSAAACPAPAANVELLRMYPGQGSNQFTYDLRGAGPATIHAYRLASMGGHQAWGGELTFGSNAIADSIGLLAKVWFSRCPGDDSWAKAYHYDLKDDPKQGIKAQTFNPCYRQEAGLDAFTMSWGPADDPVFAKGGPGGIYSCPIPKGETWYLNVQYADAQGHPTCPRGRKWMCGHTFGFHCGNLDQCGWGHENTAFYEMSAEEKASYPNNLHYKPNPGWDGKCEGGVFPQSSEPGCAGPL